METIKLKNKDYEVVKKIVRNKLLVKRNNKLFVIVPFDTYMNYSLYLNNKKLLHKNKVEMAQVIKKDKKALLVLEEYIEGTEATKILAEGLFEKKQYEELFRIFRNNRYAKIALNYKPENFVYHKKYMYYISDEIYRYNPSLSFEKTDDIYLWMDTDLSKRYCESKGCTYKDRILIRPGGELNKQLALLCVTFW